jgi:hypothetical protein
LTPFLLTPYECLEGDTEGSKDAFNFHLSCCRIYIECAFGELVMRWGIFWRTLLFNLKKSAKVVQVAMLLHNFIIDCREADDREDDRFFQMFDIQMDTLQVELTHQTGEMPRAIVTDNNEPRPKGRPSAHDLRFRELGTELRHRLMIQLATREMRRPLQHDMHYNSHGHIYMTS